MLAPRVDLPLAGALLEWGRIAIDLVNAMKSDAERWDMILANANLDAQISRSRAEIAVLQDPAALADHRRQTLTALLGQFAKQGGDCGVPLNGLD